MILAKLRVAVQRRRKGAIAMISVAAMIPLTAMFAANANTGQMVEERRKMQDAADALAMTHGAWTARSMNMLAMNRITSMQLLSVAAGSEALEGAMQEVEFTALLVAAQLAAHGASHCWRVPLDEYWWTPVCAGWHALIGVPALKAVVGTSFVPGMASGIQDLIDFDPDDLSDEEREALEDSGVDLDALRPPMDLLSGRPVGVWDIRQKYAPKHGIDVSHKALEAVIGMDEAIISQFPQVMAEIGEEYARLHEVDAFHFNDPCEDPSLSGCSQSATHNGMALPLEEVPNMLGMGSGFDTQSTVDFGAMTSGATERARYCGAFFLGTPGAGPFNLMNTTFRARGFPNNRGPLMHGGSRGTPVLKRHLNDTTSIGKILHDFKDFYRRDNILSHMPRHWTVPGLDPFGQWANLIGTQATSGPNSFTRRFDLKMASICSGVTMASLLPSGLPGIADLPDWVPFKWMIALDIQAPLPVLLKPKDVPTLQVPPWVQPDQMPDAFRILALTQAAKGKRLAAQVLTDNVQNHFGYGQVGVYNPDDASLYSQNWQYRMMPATRADDARDLAGNLSRQAPGAFGDLSQSLNGVGHGTWSRVNAH